MFLTQKQWVDLFESHKRVGKDDVGVSQTFDEPTDKGLEELFDAIRQFAPHAQSFVAVGSGIGRVVLYALEVKGYDARGIEFVQTRHDQVVEFAQHAFDMEPAETERRFFRGNALLDSKVSQDLLCGDIVYSDDLLTLDLQLLLAERLSRCSPAPHLFVTGVFHKQYQPYFYLKSPEHKVTLSMNKRDRKSPHVFYFLTPREAIPQPCEDELWSGFDHAVAVWGSISDAEGQDLLSIDAVREALPSLETLARARAQRIRRSALPRPTLKVVNPSKKEPEADEEPNVPEKPESDDEPNVPEKPENEKHLTVATIRDLTLEKFDFLCGLTADGVVEVKESSLSGAGRGAFALRDLPRGFVVGTYDGTIYANRKKWQKKNPGSKGDYLFTLMDGRVVDGEPTAKTDQMQRPSLVFTNDYPMQDTRRFGGHPNALFLELHRPPSVDQNVWKPRIPINYFPVHGEKRFRVENQTDLSGSERVVQWDYVKTRKPTTYADACVLMVTTEPVKAGSEIFVDYGSSYWVDDDEHQIGRLQLLSDQIFFANKEYFAAHPEKPTHGPRKDFLVRGNLPHVFRRHYGGDKPYSTVSGTVTNFQRVGTKSTGPPVATPVLVETQKTWQLNPDYVPQTLPNPTNHVQ